MIKLQRIVFHSMFVFVLSLSFRQAQAESFDSTSVSGDSVNAKTSDNSPATAEKKKSGGQSIANAKLIGASTDKSYFEIADSIKTDLTNESSNRTTKNTLAFSYNKALGSRLNGDLSFNVETGLSSIAQGMNIERTKANPMWEDLSLNLSYDRKLFKRSHLSISVGEALPTGYVSQMEAYKSILDLNLSFATPIFINSLVLKNHIGGAWIVNTYESSPNSLQSNPLLTGDYSIALRYIFNRNWSFGVSENFKTVRFINGADEMVSASSESINYNFKSFSMALISWNGSYDYNDSPATLYFDAYREIVSLMVSYDF